MRFGAAITALALVVVACGDDGNGALPAVTLPALGGEGEIDVGGIGGPAVINLWAVWCVPCTEELPDFERASKELDDVRFIGIAETGFGEDDESVEFLAGLGVTYEQYVDTDGALAAEVEVTELPATLVVDADGDIAWRHQGQVSYDELVERLADL
jgi:thiol-disulfide isomerase/thioredoxin